MSVSWWCGGDGNSYDGQGESDRAEREYEHDARDDRDSDDYSDDESSSSDDDDD